MRLQVFTSMSSLISLLGHSSIACGEDVGRTLDVKEGIPQTVTPQSHQPEAKATEQFRFFNNATSSKVLVYSSISIRSEYLKIE